MPISTFAIQSGKPLCQRGNELSTTLLTVHVIQPFSAGTCKGFALDFSVQMLLLYFSFLFGSYRNLASKLCNPFISIPAF